MTGLERGTGALFVLISCLVLSSGLSLMTVFLIRKMSLRLYKCTASVTARPFDFIYFIIKFLGISANLRGADRLHFITFPKTSNTFLHKREKGALLLMLSFCLLSQQVLVHYTFRLNKKNGSIPLSEDDIS